MTRARLLPRPDFVARRRPDWRAWAWLAAGIGAMLAVALAAVGDVRSWWTDSQAKQALRAKSPEQAPQQERAATVARRAPADAAVAARRRIAAALDYPWPALLADIDDATPAALAWTGFVHAADAPALRLEGQMAELAVVQPLVDDFAGRPGWSAVGFTRLDGDGEAAATRRFEIAAALSAAGLRSKASLR